MKGNKGISLIILVLIIVLVIAVGAVAIVLVMNKDNTNTNKDFETQLSNQDSINNTTTEKESDKEDIYSEYNKYRQIADHNMYVNMKKGRRDSASVNSHVFYGSGEDIAIFVYGANSFSGQVDNVFDYLNDGSVPLNAIGHTDAKFKSSGKYVIEKSTAKNMKINNIDCSNFKGKVADANDRECFAYGYTFILDDIPYMLIGFVFTEEQTSTEKESIMTEIDTMMKTVRTEI